MILYQIVKLNNISLLIKPVPCHGVSNVDAGFGYLGAHLRLSSESLLCPSQRSGIISLEIH